MGVQDTTVQDSTAQGTTVQDIAVQDTTVQDTKVQDTTMQNTTDQDTTAQDNVVRTTQEQVTLEEVTTVIPEATTIVKAYDPQIICPFEQSIGEHILTNADTLSVMKIATGGVTEQAVIAALGDLYTIEFEFDGNVKKQREISN